MLSTTENKLITLLAKECDLTGPPGIMDISDVVIALSTAPSETIATIKEVYSKGLVDMNSLKTAIFLTPEGYETVECETDVEQEHAKTGVTHCRHTLIA